MSRKKPNGHYSLTIRKQLSMTVYYFFIIGAYVVGVPDDRFGEELCAWIKLKSNDEPCTVDEIKAFCKQKLAHFKVPRYVLFVDEFPTTVTGKIQKFKMRETSIQMLNLDKK